MEVIARAMADPPPPSLESLIERVLGGDEAGWPPLAGALHAEVLAICRRRRYAAASASAGDIHREVAVRALERLNRDGRRALRDWAETRARYPSAAFGAWLGVVVGHLFIDHQRGSPEFVRRRQDGGRALVAVTVVELDDQLPGRDDPARLVELARIARLLADPSFPTQQREAVILWLRGEDVAAIATALGLDGGAAQARRLLHAARERLRRRFQEHGP